MAYGQNRVFYMKRFRKQTIQQTPAGYIGSSIKFTVVSVAILNEISYFGDAIKQNKCLDY